MIHFRKMNINDLEKMFYNPILRPLVTLPPKDRMFAAIIEDEAKIIGGVSGFVVDNSAFIKCIALENSPEISTYKDGLIRALINMLELEGVTYLLVNEKEPLYYNIGFKMIGRQRPSDININILKEEYLDHSDVLWVNLKDFFK